MADPLNAAYLSVGGTLAATVITFLGTGFLQWRKERVADRRAREQTLSDALVAAVMFSTAVQVFRTAWVDHATWRRTALNLLAVFPTGQTSAGWPGRAAQVARDQDLEKRAVTADYQAMLAPKSEQMLRLLHEISLWRGRRSRPIVATAEALVTSAARLAEAAGAKDGTYRRARSASERSLAQFRAAVDRRR
ncbi:hypothetical protein [Nonomuraea bangladeshensis]|uniref:hypothetical protein n=1 Tax=Nonomuraea bangladeshensis TaxID=404385 RepID=UPI0031E0B492